MPGQVEGQWTASQRRTECKTAVGWALSPDTERNPGRQPTRFQDMSDGAVVGGELNFPLPPLVAERRG
jgi:hypothetical protein